MNVAHASRRRVCCWPRLRCCCPAARSPDDGRQLVRRQRQEIQSARRAHSGDVAGRRRCKPDADARRHAGAAAAALSQSRMAAAGRLCLQRHVSPGGAGTAAPGLERRMPARASTSIPHLTAAPVVGGGLIYVLDSEAHVFAFDAATASRVWDKRLAPKNGTDMPTLWGLLGKPTPSTRRKGMGGGVAYDDGKIFVTSGFGVLICAGRQDRQATSGSNDLGVPIVNAPVVNGGRIFVSTHDNHFYALAAERRPPAVGPSGHRRSRRHPGQHQCGGVGRIRDRALYLGRALRAARPERPGRLERCAVAHRPCHRAVASSTTSPGGR